MRTRTADLCDRAVALVLQSRELAAGRFELRRDLRAESCQLPYRAGSPRQQQGIPAARPDEGRGQCPPGQPGLAFRCHQDTFPAVRRSQTSGRRMAVARVLDGKDHLLDVGCPAGLPPTVGPGGPAVVAVDEHGWSTTERRLLPAASVRCNACDVFRDRTRKHSWQCVCIGAAATLSQEVRRLWRDASGVRFRGARLEESVIMPARVQSRVSS